MGAECIGLREALAASRNALGELDLGATAVPCFQQILDDAGLMGLPGPHNNEPPQQLHAVLMVRDNSQPVLATQVSVCLPGHEAPPGCLRQEPGKIPLLFDDPCRPLLEFGRNGLHAGLHGGGDHNRCIRLHGDLHGLAEPANDPIRDDLLPVSQVAMVPGHRTNRARAMAMILR